MITEFVSSLMTVFAIPSLYNIILWFMTVGLLVRLAVVVFFLRIKVQELFLVVARIHAISLVAGYLIAPVLSVLAGGLMSVMFAAEGIWASTVYLYVWYSIVCILVFRTMMCKTFVSVPCASWRTSLVVIDSGVAVLGYVVLQSLHAL